MSGFICRKDGDYCEAHGGAPPGCSTAPRQACGTIAGPGGGFRSFTTINTATTIANKKPAVPAARSDDTLSAAPKNYVQTIMGRGRLQTERQDGTQVIELSWRLAHGAKALLYRTP